MRRGGRAGFVSTLPPKPTGFDRAVTNLRKQFERIEPVAAHVGYGWSAREDVTDQDRAETRGSANTAQQPWIPLKEGDKRAGQWVIYVYTDDDSVVVPAQVTCGSGAEASVVSVRRRHVPRPLTSLGEKK